MQDLRGSIGIKAPIRQVYTDEEGEEILINDGIDVIPSREAIRWTDNTKLFIKNAFKEAKIESESIIEKELSTETDFIEWLKKVNSTLSYSNNSALATLSKIIDLNSVNPKFKGTNLKYSIDLNFFIKPYRLQTVGVVKYILLVTSNPFSQLDDCLFKVDCNFNYHKNKAISLSRNPQTVLEIVPEDKLKTHSTYEMAKEDDKEKVLETLVNKRNLIIKCLQESPQYKSYQDYEVSKELIDKIDEMDKEEKEKQEIAQLTPKDLRALNQETVYNKLIARDFYQSVEQDKGFKLQSVTEKILNIPKAEEKVYYGLMADESKAQYYFHMTNNRFTDIRLVSNQNKKYYKHLKHLDNLFGEVKKDIMSIDNKLLQWNTCRIIKPIVDQILFLKNYSDLDSEVSDKFIILSTYLNNYNFEIDPFSSRYGVKEFKESFETFLNTMGELQEYLEESRTPEEITEKVNSLNFPDKSIKGALVYDEEIVNTAKELYNSVKALIPLFTQLPILYTNKALPSELVLALTEYITFKTK